MTAMGCSSDPSGWPDISVVMVLDEEEVMMKPAFVPLIVLLMVSSTIFGQAPDKNGQQDGKAEQQLRNLVRAWDDAYVKGDAAALDRLLADEFSFVGGPNKAQYLNS